MKLLVQKEKPVNLNSVPFTVCRLPIVKSDYPFLYYLRNIEWK